MVALQRARPELSHGTVAAVIDAESRLLDDQENDKATGLLDAVAATDTGRECLIALLNLGLPPRSAHRTRPRAWTIATGRQQ
jgi:hypothetical protein